ncbi:hypothetical protein ACFO5X_20885 [Seohaeicola nanhaiensis]|uniref:Uncharacterized protein n=1 Tax=Seohaeicola nanhaiensis TaxID=1387282 RepID=A0ABV9KM05_9RHOB
MTKPTTQIDRMTVHALLKALQNAEKPKTAGEGQATDGLACAERPSLLRSQASLICFPFEPAPKG